MGMAEPRATRIYNGYLAAKAAEAEEPYGLEDCFEDYTRISFVHFIPDSDDIWDLSDDWRGFLIRMGCTEELQDVFMDEDFLDVRCTQSAKTWMRDTMVVRYGYIRDVLEGGKSALMEEPKEFDKPWDHEDTILWKAIDRERLCVRGGFRMNRVFKSKLHDDFLSDGVISLYQQREVADKFAAFLQRRKWDVPPLMVRVTLPNYAIWPHKRMLPFSDLWKMVVFLRKRGYCLPQTPEFENIGHKSLILGPVSMARELYVDKMSSWEELGEEHVMKVEVDGAEVEAIQWNFGDEIYRDLLVFYAKVDLEVWQ